MGFSKFLGIAIIAFFFHSIVVAQLNPSDSVFVTASSQRAKDLYNLSTKAYSHLYNGKEYMAFKKSMPSVGTPFYHSDEWEEGVVFYDGELYEKVSLRYDLLQEKLVIEHPGLGEIELINEKIKYFVIEGHTFVMLNDKVGNKALINPGFYDELYNGKSKVYVKRLKVTEERIETQVSIILTFKEKNNYIINKKGLYYLVGSKSAALKVFGDQKSALRKFVSKNKINFRKDREAALVEIVKHYDEITR